jgi:hypothetical protein
MLLTIFTSFLEFISNEEFEWQSLLSIVLNFLEGVGGGMEKGGMEW